MSIRFTDYVVEEMEAGNVTLTWTNEELEDLYYESGQSEMDQLGEYLETEASLELEHYGYSFDKWTMEGGE